MSKHYLEGEECHQAVLHFISRFTKNSTRPEVEECFTEGCCYWFAYILYHRFYGTVKPRYVEVKSIRIMYAPVDCHFGCEIYGKVYDITGDVTDKYQWTSWWKYQMNEKNSGHLKNIMENVINF